MAAYEFNGEKYKQASTHQKEWGRSLIDQLDFSGNETVLDLGCGDGALPAQIAASVPEGKVVGVDSSAGMLETAGKLEAGNLTFRLRDINDIDFSDEFDVIFSNAALHWVLDHASLLRKAFRALKPGGRILWNFAGAGNCGSFIDVVQRTMKDEQYAQYFEDFTWPWFMPSAEQYTALIEPMGFSEFEVTEENKDRRFADADQMVRWIDQPSLVPFLEHVPDSAKEQFRRDVIGQMIDRTRQSDGTCFETFRRLNVKAVK